MAQRTEHWHAGKSVTVVLLQLQQMHDSTCVLLSLISKHVVHRRHWLSSSGCWLARPLEELLCLCMRTCVGAEGIRPASNKDVRA
jgi:hypothetical protein